MTMTKKDFELLAGVIRDLRDPREVERRSVDADMFPRDSIDLLSVENTLVFRLERAYPNFNASTFRRACRA